MKVIESLKKAKNEKKNISPVLKEANDFICNKKKLIAQLPAT